MVSKLKRSANIFRQNLEGLVENFESGRATDIPRPSTFQTLTAIPSPSRLVRRESANRRANTSETWAAICAAIATPLRDGTVRRLLASNLSLPVEQLLPLNRHFPSFLCTARSTVVQRERSTTDSNSTAQGVEERSLRKQQLLLILRLWLLGIAHPGIAAMARSERHS